MVSYLVHAVLPISILLWGVTTVFSDTCSENRGYPGVPGIPGDHGANGKDGLKGQKGDNGNKAEPVKGAKGDRGMPGNPGRAGIKGNMGMEGPPGPQGPKGQKGAIAGVPKNMRSFFSYKRSPQYRQNVIIRKPIEFDVLTSPNQDGDPLTNGEFTATLRGTYFFVYHISAASTACLNIKKNAEILVNLCDITQGVLVTSGSVVVKLEKGDKVSVQAFQNSNIISKDADSTFTGFLLFQS
ncbi:complement C1q subcomponent subunit B [Astyanax mexicanus]|uniref:Complement C1q subcomponent subunit B n=1 Tax=Astyanax mexicanus TaxID=7994 RepID=A0A8B9RD91_ASTMX|nr:complement C1q subcomponent subunit B [Astyanax mexicanus]